VPLPFLFVAINDHPLTFCLFQAEEAQKMKRKIKAENLRNLRILDMERRQKQRLEEIRESQKKV